MGPLEDQLMQLNNDQGKVNAFMRVIDQDKTQGHPSKTKGIESKEIMQKKMSP